MAQQPHDKLARTLIDPSGREVLWPLVFAGVKNVVRANNLNNDTLTCIKSWLKANDSQLHIPLLGLTVLHTISLNCSPAVRNQMATPKLMQRLEKQLARPQGPQVATAIVQVLVDWAYLFSQEDLGQRCSMLLEQPRHRQMAAGCAPSPAVLSMQEERQMGVPQVAPARGEDFIRWMYSRGASLIDRTPSLANGNAHAGFTGWPSVLSGGLPGGAPPAITTQAVPELCQRMQADTARLVSALTTCRGAARLQRAGELTAAMDAAYREAERCSQWRRRVQDYTQRCDDPAGLSSVLSATDVLNAALQNWQHFTGREMYDTMRIAVPPPPPAMRRAATAAAAAAAGPRDNSGRTGAAGRGARELNLLDMVEDVGPGFVSAAGPPAVPAQQPRPPADSFNPFAPGGSGSASASSSAHAPAAGSAAAAGPPPQRLAAPSTNPFGPPVSLSSSASGSTALGSLRLAPPGAAATSASVRPPPDWDPFAPAPAPPTTTAPATTPATAASFGGSSWTAFGQDTAAGGGVSSWVGGGAGIGAGPLSPSLTSPQPSGAVMSPSGTSITSASSTPSGAIATVSMSMPNISPSSPRHPPAGSSYLQPFQDLLNPVMISAATPHAAANSGAAADAVRATSVTTKAGASALSTGQHAAASISASQPSNVNSSAIAAAAAAAAHPHLAAAGDEGPSPASAPATVTAAAASQSTAGGHGNSNRSTPGSPTALHPSLEWQPEFERLASELRTLLSPASPSSAGPSATLGRSSSVVADGAAAVGLLPAVLERVRGMCEALAAQHARQVAAVLAPLRSASVTEAMLSRDTGGSGSSSGVHLAKLREVASAFGTADVAGRGAAASANGGAQGLGGAGAGAANGSWSVGPAAGANGWVGFGASNGRPLAAAMGPLQQHLIQHQQQQARVNGSVFDPFARTNGRDAGPSGSLI